MRSLLVRSTVDLNVIYVYVADVGDFRAYSPIDVIQRKREADRVFYMYRPYWSSQTEERYRAFMDAAFETYTGLGRLPRIRARSDEKKVAIEVDGEAWNAKWNPLFSEGRATNYQDAYYELVSSLLADTTSSKGRRIVD